MDALNHLRQEIDALDRELIQLFAKRLELVTQVGEVKHEKGLPIYVPERELTMLQARREEAAKAGISPQLIEDVLRRFMRESYSNENQFGFKTLNPAINKIVIVGGYGKMGQLFARYLRASGYPISILDRDDWDVAERILTNADVVIVSVPIDHTLETIERFSFKIALTSEDLPTFGSPITAM